MAPRTGPATRDKLLDAAVRTIREKGFAATKVDDLCATTALTKGAFFHHFESKEALALAAIEHFGQRAGAMFSSARYRRLVDPRDRVLGYVDLRIAMLDGALPEVTCLHGTLVQEVYATHPGLRAAAARHLEAGANELAADLAAAKKRYAPRALWTPRSLALFVEAVIQGAFVMAKATQSTRAAADCLGHLRGYLESQMRAPSRRRPHD
jgi:TetR/AcrR family transcriptional regulator, transcriptional repressor for nem operon